MDRLAGIGQCVPEHREGGGWTGESSGVDGDSSVVDIGLGTFP